MSTSKRLVVAGICFCVLAVAGVRWVIRARSGPEPVPCDLNLRVINDAKNQWGVERHRSTNDIPTWNDILPYLPSSYKRDQIPICSQGGTYKLGKLGEYPTCTFHGN
jgi:hypothetical protein